MLERTIGSLLILTATASPLRAEEPTTPLKGAVLDLFLSLRSDNLSGSDSGFAVHTHGTEFVSFTSADAHRVAERSLSGFGYSLGAALDLLGERWGARGFVGAGTGLEGGLDVVYRLSPGYSALVGIGWSEIRGQNEQYSLTRSGPFVEVGGRVRSTGTVHVGLGFFVRGQAAWHQKYSDETDPPSAEYDFHDPVYALSLVVQLSVGLGKS
jgi:hypothetical protein